jgi:hypothetical protein
MLKSAVTTACPAYRRVLHFTLPPILSGLYFRITRLSMIAIDCITGKSQNLVQTEEHGTYDIYFPSNTSVILRLAKIISE